VSSQKLLRVREHHPRLKTGCMGLTAASGESPGACCGAAVGGGGVVKFCVLRRQLGPHCAGAVEPGDDGGRLGCGP
jgi:hypothetical protein